MLRSRLPEINAEIAAGVHEAITAGAELVTEAAKARVPVDTGRLRDHIHVEPTATGAYVVAGDRDVFYGHLVEHGSIEGQPAHPFLLPALEENRAAIEQLVAAAVKKAS